MNPHPCCPTCGSPLRRIQQNGPVGITALRCIPCNAWIQKADWR